MLGGRFAGQLADGQAVAGGLGHDHQHRQGHDHDRHQRELRHTKGHWRAQFEPGRIAHAAEVGHAEGCGNQASCEQADEHAEVADKARKLGVDHQRHADRRQPQQQVGGLAEVFGARVAAAQPNGRRRHQRDADDGNQAADDHWGKEAQQAAEHRRQGNGDGACRNHRTKYLAEPELLADHDHRRQGDERAALDQRQAGTEFPEAQGLDQRRYTRGQQVGVDQGDDLGRCQSQRTAQNQRHRHGTGVHHQHVLQAEGEQLSQGQNLVHRMNPFSAHVVCLLKVRLFCCWQELLTSGL
ncbi:hypothetical protein D3C77_58910 [compost metagenome]